MDLSAQFKAAPLIAPPLNAPEVALREAQAGDALYAQGHFAAARERYAEAIRLQPETGGYHWLLAVCDWAMGDRDRVGQSLQTAVRLNPQLAYGQEALGHWYLAHGMVESALEASAKAAAISPQNDGIMASRAWVLEASGEIDEAWAIVQGLIQRGYAPPMVVMLYGRVARHRGQQENALTLVNNLLWGGNLSISDQAGLHFTAANLLDGMGCYDEAFVHAAQANAQICRAYSPATHEATLQRLMTYFTRENLNCLPKASYPQ